eukprot:2277180-Heterocapsa_arctica.AAC.1
MTFLYRNASPRNHLLTKQTLNPPSISASRILAPLLMGGRKGNGSYSSRSSMARTHQERL